MNVKCNGCDKEWRAEDTAPYSRDAEGKDVYACRNCIGDWIKRGFLNPNFPFWKLKEGIYA